VKVAPERREAPRLGGAAESAPPVAVRQRVLALAWPSVLEQTLLTLVSLVDTYIVGHLGAEAIASVGLGSQVLMLTNSLFMAAGVGATALVARSTGARDQTEANGLAHQALLAGFSLGLAATLIIFPSAGGLFHLLGAQADVVASGAAWLRIVSLSFPFIALVLVGNAAMRGAGDMRASLLVMAVVNTVNIALAWSLTRGAFGLPRLGVVGTGIATASGQTVGGLMVLALMRRGRAGIKLQFGLLARPHWGRLGRMMKVGLPAGAEQLMLQLALINMAAIVTRFGTAAYAAHTVTIRVSALSYLPGWGFSVAATTMVGQELGARRPDRARAAALAAMRMALGVMVLMGLVLFAFPGAILRFFTSDAAVINAGLPLMRLSATAQPVIAAAFVFAGALRGAGDTRAAMFITILSVWGVRLVLTYLLGVVMGLGVIGVWVGFNADWLFRAVLFWLRFRSGQWRKLQV
jgi:putative MATE family efflux protein